jgi:hypothetical protein
MNIKIHKIFIAKLKREEMKFFDLNSSNFCNAKPMANFVKSLKGTVKCMAPCMNIFRIYSEKKRRNPEKKPENINKYFTEKFE